MKRWLWAVPLVVLGLLGWPRDQPGVTLGEWSGTTTQGRWVKFLVDEGEEGLEITRWGLGLVLTCGKTGKVLNGGIVAGFPIPIRDGRFEHRLAERFAWIDWSGVFTTPRNVQGVWSVAFPVLTGEGFAELDAEACKAGAIGFTAHPGGGDDDDARARARDFEIRIERGAAGQPVARMVWLASTP